MQNDMAAQKVGKEIFWKADYYLAVAYLDSIISKNSRMVVGFVSVPKFTSKFTSPSSP